MRRWFYDMWAGPSGIKNFQSRSLKALKMHFWDPSQWVKMCFEYQRIKIKWKNGLKFLHLLTGRAEGAEPPPPYGQSDLRGGGYFLLYIRLFYHGSSVLDAQWHRLDLTCSRFKLNFFWCSRSLGYFGPCFKNSCKIGSWLKMLLKLFWGCCSWCPDKPSCGGRCQVQGRLKPNKALLFDLHLHNT